MNRRLVARIIKRKHEEFLASITDEEVRKLVARDAIITGGSIANLLVNEAPKDFDYYFETKETAAAVAAYYVKWFNELNPDLAIKPKVMVTEDRVKIVVQSAGITAEAAQDRDYKYFEQHPDSEAQAYVEHVMKEADEVPAEAIDKEEKDKPKYRPVFLSANAITLSDKVQLVIRFYGTADEIHKNYDFAHCTCSWLAREDRLTLPPHALESLLTKQLVYMGSLYPLCSIIRARKFIMKGWWINAGQYLKMCFQLNELDLTKIEVLEEQLTGVDAAYFIQVIDYCKQRMSEDAEFKVTMPYLVSIVDKIFG